MEEIKNNETVVVSTENEKGASMLEYALLAALISVVAIAAMTFLGGQVSTTFSNVGSSMSNANTTN